jgi:hypothetical protein
VGQLFITFSFHGHAGYKGHFIPDPLNLLYFICCQAIPKGLHSNCSSLLPQPTPSPIFLSVLSPTSFTNFPFPHIYSILQMSPNSCLMLFLFCKPICGILIVPRASEKEGQVRLDHSPAPTQLALLSPICFPRSKRPIAATRVPLNDSTPQ